MHPSIFKAYDIRGMYPSQIDETTAYRIGYAAVKELKAKTLAIGRDARLSGPSLMQELVRGVRDAGCDVIDIDMVTTPMLYFASWHLDVDGAISITASHNPVEYNGVKICRKDAIPVGEMSGLTEIRDIVLSEAELEKTMEQGSLSQQDIKDAYYEYFSQFAQFGDKKFKIVIDCANTMGVLELPFYKQYFKENFDIVELYCSLDKPYSAHEANPLKTETLKELQSKVVKEQADFGISYDGDADRIGFIDEKGNIIPMDIITAFLAKIFLKDAPGSTILYDLRSSRSIKEIIEENGGIAHECRVGHSFIKKQMREENALFAGELSGHYYLEANKNGEASTVAAFMVCNLLAEENKPLSMLVHDMLRYAHSGEINSEVEDKEAIMEKLKKLYSNGNLSELDGIKIDYPDWWFNVRPSNTEPVLRLNLEAKTPELMEAKRDEILAVIRG